MGTLIITALFEGLKESTELVKVVQDGQPPDVRAELWRRHMDETKWISVLMVKFSDAMVKLIEQGEAKP